MVEIGQIRTRKEIGYSILARNKRIRVGHEHPMFKNIFQLYDADTDYPCGCWSADGIEENWPRINSPRSYSKSFTSTFIRFLKENINEDRT